MRRTRVTLASTTNGEKTSSGNHSGQWPACHPARPIAPLRNPYVTEPASPMKTRAGWKLKSRKAAAHAASVAHADASGASPASAAPTA